RQAMRYLLSLAFLATLGFAQVETTIQIPRQPVKTEMAKDAAKPEAAQPKEAEGGRGGRGAPGTGGIMPKDLKHPPLRPIEVPNVASATLPNGMKLLLLEDHELPVVSGLAMVHAGTLLDPPERIGLASATATLLRSGGTSAKTPDQLENLLETMAASIESTA